MKNNGKIYYISPFLPIEDRFKLYYSPAAQSKVSYIRTLLKNENIITVCINCSLTVDNCFQKTYESIDECGTFVVLPFKSSRNRIFLSVNILFMLINVFLFVLKNIKKSDTVILYHSIFYDNVVRILKKLKGFKLIYEVEEIYADVRNNGKSRNCEIKSCQKNIDGYIFPTELLNTTINNEKKPHVIIYGAYNPTKVVKKKNDKTIVVYSGTLMEGKGATQSVECSEYLDENYEIRIIGFGNEKELNKLLNIINQSNNKCKVYYDGMKYGNEYFEYMNKCDIGLCIQPSKNSYNMSSFPSKIMNYLNCNLKVVATRMETLEKSKIKNYLFFSETDHPKAIAEAIKQANKSDALSSNLIYSLHVETEKKIIDLLEKINL